MLNNFEKLPIFKDAHSTVLLMYKITKKFPVDEKYSLVSQLLRSAASIPVNIIEGNARNHQKEYIEFLYFAKGSLEETKYHLLLSLDLGYIKKDEYLSIQEKLESVGKQLNGLINYWKGKNI
jgi:four helix bundle protein